MGNILKILERERTYTFSEFVVYLDQIPEREAAAAERTVMRNRTLRKIAVTTVAVFLFKSNIAYAAASYEAGMDNILARILDVARSLGKGICVVLAIKEVIQEALRGGGFKEIGLIFIKFAVVLASLYFIPQFYNDIPTMFEY